MEAGVDASLRSAHLRAGVIIPALNEENAIGLVLRDIPRGIVDQVIVVDNGSTDHTAYEAKSRGAIVKFERERGYRAACQAGLGALAPDIEIVVFLDADYSDHPEEIEMLVRPIAQNRADFVIGSRTLEDASRRALSWQQHSGNWLATMLIRWCFGYQFTDSDPFRAIRRGALETLCMKDRGYGWTVEMQVKAACTGLRVMEVPVCYRPRIGKSKISGTLKGSVCAGAKILCTIGKYSLAFPSYCRTLARRTSTES
ncbi:MAG: glycosyltransferase family 2 protein [Candidatus Acidiferrales bacterium]